jgi:hypothetical protein
VFASIFILVVSLVLLVYWFRYTCLLILSTRTARDYSREIVEANGLAFVELRKQLAEAATAGDLMDRIQSSLDRDYRLVTYLLQNAAGYRPEGHEFEEWMLRLDYWMMNVMYRSVRRVSQPIARRALLEMTSVLNHLANAMGERLHASAQA